jgi:uncharacterized protein YegJ (DUF2314 family)
MTTDDDQLIPVFVPALFAVLILAEDKKGEPLTPEEVIEIRDKCQCIMMTVADARKMDDTRGRDIDPENSWYDWQRVRREFGRKPDLDPGPMFSRISNTDPEYQRTVHDARSSLDRFRDMLSADDSLAPYAMVKAEVCDGDSRAFMWLTNTRKSGSGFVAELFEVPNTFLKYKVGDQLEIGEDAILDWAVNDNGSLYGGFSIRYQRSKLPESEWSSYDNYIGVSRYM